MIEAHERALLEETVGAAIARAGAAGAGIGAVDAALAQLGWPSMLAEEPRDAVDLVFRALGANDASATALDDVIASALGVEPRSDRAVLLPLFGSWDPPGRFEGGSLRAGGLATSRVAAARELLVACGTTDAVRFLVVPVAAARVERVGGIDPGAGVHSVSVAAESPGARSLDASGWEAGVAAARRALACQIAGATRAMLALARTHALERSQFGRPIARFQAVRHKLAEALVAVEALDAAASAALEEGGAETAALAKAVAGRTARAVSTHCQQVLAGIGFTTEHPFHRFLKRVIVLEGLFGSADDIVLDLGRRLLASRRVPTLVEL